MHDFFKLRVRPWGFLTAAGFLGLLGSVSGFFGRYAWWLDIGSHFRVQYTVLFAVLAVCYLVGKKRGWALACLLLAVINFIPVAAYRFPTRGYDPVAGLSLKVALVNVNTQMGKPDDVARFLQRENPDVLILEEINDEWMRRLSPALKGYPDRIVEVREDNFGIGVFARTGIISTQVVYFGTADVPSIIATMDLYGQPFTLVATHPLPPVGAEYSRLRNEQLDCVAGYVSTNNGPLILLGDLNITPWSPLYRDFIRKSGLVDSSRGRAIHPSWPSFSPLFLIPVDHCLHNAGVAIKSKRVGESMGSDHLPVIVEFGLKDEGDDDYPDTQRVRLSFRALKLIQENRVSHAEEVLRQKAFDPALGRHIRKELQSGDKVKAISMLNLFMDVWLVNIAADAGPWPPSEERKRALPTDLLNEIRVYRITHPSNQDDEAVRDTIRRVLAEFTK